MTARPLALVTGASSGFGAQFARRFAASGADLVLVARREDRLRALAADLDGSGATAHVLPVDLARPDGPAALVDDLAARGLQVDALVNCAGFGTYGRFADTEPGRLSEEIAVNVTAPTVLTRALLPQLLASPRGTLVNVTSTAAFQPGPYIAVYAATKAYLQSLTEAIWAETRDTRLRVVALAPGPARTEFFTVAGSEGFAVGQLVTAEQVVDAALRRLRRRRGGPTVVVGAGNVVQATAARLAPRPLTLSVAARQLGAGLREGGTA